MNQWREDMKARTHAFAVGVVRFLNTILDGSTTKRLKNQLLGAASGTDLNWHAACRARSHDEFRAKLGTVLEEIDEAEECFDLLYDSNICRTDECQRLRRESKELRAIFAKATRTANQNAERRRRDQRSRTR